MEKLYPLAALHAHVRRRGGRWKGAQAGEWRWPRATKLTARYAPKLLFAVYTFLHQFISPLQISSILYLAGVFVFADKMVVFSINSWRVLSAPKCCICDITKRNRTWIPSRKKAVSHKLTMRLRTPECSRRRRVAWAIAYVRRSHTGVVVLLRRWRRSIAASSAGWSELGRKLKHGSGRVSSRAPPRDDDWPIDLHLRRRYYTLLRCAPPHLHRPRVAAEWTVDTVEWSAGRFRLACACIQRTQAPIKLVART
jgi:hypothetical protein